MTDDQLKQMEQKLDEIVAAAAVLLAMIQHVKEPANTPSPFSGGGPGPK
jgi:hypothetical protein